MIDRFFIEQTCKQLGSDPKKIKPGTSFFDTRVILADMAVAQCMRDEDFRRELHEKKVEYLHSKGWSLDKKFKQEYVMPQSAHLLLPVEMRLDKKALIQWLKTRHPYLILK